MKMAQKIQWAAVMRHLCLLTPNLGPGSSLSLNAPLPWSVACFGTPHPEAGTHLSREVELRKMERVRPQHCIDPQIDPKNWKKT